jgi:hypothetical protein
MPSRRLAPAILLLAIALIALASECVYAAPQDTESMPLDVANLLTYEGLLPFISFQYPVDAKISGDDLYVEQQYLGYMVSIEPGASVPGQAYFQATVMLTKSYDSAIDVMDHYLMELDHYMEPDFSHHTISASVRADGERFASFAGRGYVAHGIVVADGPLQGMSFSEEFHNFVLPGNVDLRVIFKYPTAVQNNEDMRKVFELILSSLTVHSDYFYLAGETRIDSLKRRHRN